MGLIETVKTIIGKQLLTMKIPMRLARFAARFTPLYYQIARVKPRFTSYSLDTIISNSVISHAKARRELGYTPRPLRESLADTVRWFLQQRSNQTGSA